MTVLRHIISAASPIGRAALEAGRTPVGRMGYSAGLGALYGGITSDSKSATGTFNDILGGAGLGLGLYGAGSAGLKLGEAAIKKSATNTNYTQLAKTGYQRTKQLAGMGFKAARFAVENPLLTAGGIGAVGMAAYGLNYQPGSPTMEGVNLQANFNAQSNAASLLQSNQYAQPTIGTTNQMSNRYRKAYQQSTVGLTQGMHRSRH